MIQTNSTPPTLTALAAGLALLAITSHAPAEPADLNFDPHIASGDGGLDESDAQTLVDAASLADDAQVEARGVTLTAKGDALAVDVKFDPAQSYPGFVLPAPDGVWDLSQRHIIAMDVTNTGTGPMTVGMRIDNEGGDESTANRIDKVEDIQPGETRTVSIRLYSTPWRLVPPIDLVGMHQAPGLSKLDTTAITRLLVYSREPRTDQSFEIRNIRTVGTMVDVDSETFLPFVDRFGQFAHREFEGKITSDEQLREIGDAELAHTPTKPETWSKFGGWADGPQLEATGEFRTAKHEGKWYLVDPEGFLFWSHGVTSIHHGYSETGVPGREDYFAELPPRDGEIGDAHSTSSWAPHGYYHDKRPFDTINFYVANLVRKYGDDWETDFASESHDRLMQFGLNSMGSWGLPLVYQEGRTPYAAMVWVMGSVPHIEGSTGYWGQFPDPFHPDFRRITRERLSEFEQEANDPMCYGFFIDNEMAWGTDTSLAEAALASPPDQPAKVAFVEDLKKHYDDIDALNQVWGTNHASWDALLNSTDVPEVELAGDDLRRFYTQIAEMYFRVMDEELARLNPDKLYLGNRFAWRNDAALHAAAKFCDVVSINSYSNELSHVKLPEGVDKPVIIGEFHFGATDRNHFHPGLSGVPTQAGRADAYRTYVMSGLAQPHIVGVHWFQYVDQAISGRSDGENYNAGFVDITDQPYTELTETARELGEKMYELRAK